MSRPADSMALRLRSPVRPATRPVTKAATPSHLPACVSSPNAGLVVGATLGGPDLAALPLAVRPPRRDLTREPGEGGFPRTPLPPGSSRQDGVSGGSSPVTCLSTGRAL